ncbi:MAG: hypothetical protein B7Y47_01630 [Sphingomonas sp. 28-63-12]|nr:MAG: hypothetical protein B7Y47_01630 [Sphingomonas sp. 28-63-12]
MSRSVGAVLAGGLLVAALGASPAMASLQPDRAQPATAEPTPAPQSPSEEARADGRKYCAKSEALTGSRLPRRICKTRADWARDGVDVDHPSA